MTRAGAYGQSFALMHLTEGRAAEALAAAESAIAADPLDPEPVLDRAQIHLAEKRWSDAVADVERAVALDREAMVLDDSVVDDTAFSALVGWAQGLAGAGDTPRAIAVIERYEAIVPDVAATHHDEAATWIRRFKGDAPMWRREA